MHPLSLQPTKPSNKKLRYMAAAEIIDQVIRVPLPDDLKLWRQKYRLHRLNPGYFPLPDFPAQ